MFTITVLFTLFLITNGFVKRWNMRRFPLDFHLHLLVDLIEPPPPSINLNDVYTLIWHECKECDILLKNMEELELQFTYIDGGYYFYDLDIANDPLFYKHDELIGENLFDIYTEIYKNV